jgi:hypothetical protein
VESERKIPSLGRCLTLRESMGVWNPDHFELVKEEEMTKYLVIDDDGKIVESGDVGCCR